MVVYDLVESDDRFCAITVSGKFLMLLLDIFTANPGRTG